MARPQKLHADWFSHPTNLRHQKEIILLEDELGLSGYATYLAILEYAAAQDHGKLVLTDDTIKAIAADQRLKISLVKATIRSATDKGLIKIDRWQNAKFRHLNPTFTTLQQERERHAIKYKTAKNRHSSESQKIVLPGKTNDFTG